MSDMDTFELKHPTKEQRLAMRMQGFSLENLGEGWWNATCCTDDTDQLTDLLNSLAVEYRMV